MAVSTELLDALGWTPPPPSGEAVRGARESVSGLRGIRLSANARRERIRDLRRRMADLVLALERAEAEARLTEPDDSGFAPPRNRVSVGVISKLWTGLKDTTHMLMFAGWMGGFSPEPAPEPPPMQPPTTEQMDPGALYGAWMDVLDSTALRSQLDDDFLFDMLERREAQADEDPYIQFWVGIRDQDADMIYEAMERGARPDRSLRSVVEEWLYR